MRVLHTSDWHLGKRLDQFSRLEEQRLVLEEIVGIADEKAVDLVLITGDLFDSYNPPVEAEDLFFRTLKKLSAHGRRPVVALAGNHDSADAIQAPDPLARLHGIVLLGYPGTKMTELTSEGGVEISFPAPGLLEIKLPPEKKAPPVRILAAPYANEKRLRGLFQELEDENPGGAAEAGDARGDGDTDFQGEIPTGEEIIKRLSAYWKEVGERFFTENTVNITAAHLFCLPAGGRGELSGEIEEPEDEKPILYPGGLAPLTPEAFPEGSRYVALGHLHRPQDVATEPFPVSYCGSPLAYSRSEASQQKYVYCVDLEPGEKAKIEKVPLKSGMKILRGRFSDVNSALTWLQENTGSYVEITLELDSFLSSGDRQQLYGAHPRILSIIPEMNGDIPGEKAPPADTDKPVAELFAEYFSSEHGGAELPGELMDLFREILAARDLQEPAE